MKKQDILDFFLKPFRASTYRDLAVVLEQFPAGIYHFTLLVAGMATSVGLVSSVVAAPLALPVLVGTVYIARRSVNVEYKGVREEAERHGVELTSLRKIGGEDFLDLSKKMLSDGNSWSTLLVSLLRLPVGLAAFTYVVFYFSLSFSLAAAPFLYRSQGYLRVGSTSAVNTLPEALLVSASGVLVFVAGANLLGLLAKGCLVLMSYSVVEENA
ncbi:MAG: sensor domain-containing protein [Candidatus Nanohaloarchaea archaeon]